jgi:SSS family solute:Na+ symporter
LLLLAEVDQRLRVSGLIDKVTHSAGGGAEQLRSWPGDQLAGFSNSFLSVIGIVFGLGFVLSFGYWTTNFVEVQRAMATKSMSAARSTPIIGSFPKMFIPFIVVIPGMIAAVLVPETMRLKAGAQVTGVTYNDSILLLLRDVLPNGLLGVALAGGVVDRVVRLSNGEYEVHYIGVNWPHHIFVDEGFTVVGAE